MFLLILAPAASPSRPSVRAPAPDSTAVDSVVLERTAGYSYRPAYRVSVARTGAIHFVRLPGERPGDRDPPGPRAGAATVAPATFRRLVGDVGASGLGAMPAAVRGDPALCPAFRTDAAHAIVAVFRASGVRRVDVYLGCRATPGGDFVPRVRRLVALADAIDAAAGTRRWLRDASRDG